MGAARYTVPEVSCGHCVDAITAAVRGVAGVAEVAVDLQSKVVTVHGDGVNDAAVRAAIDEAGYEVAASASGSAGSSAR